MATTYSTSLVGDEGLNQARFELGDVGHILDDAGASVWILQDEEISALITAFGYSEGVAKAADSCITRTAQQPEVYEDEGKSRVEWRERQNAWKYLAARLRSRVGTADQSAAVPVTVKAGVTNAVSGASYLGIPTVS